MKVAIVGGAGWFAIDLVRKVFSDQRMHPIDLHLPQDLYESLSYSDQRGRLVVPPYTPPKETKPSHYQVGIIGVLEAQADE